MKNCTRKDHLPWIIGLAFAARSSWPLFRNLKLFLDEMFQRNALKAIFLGNFVAFFIVSLKYLAKFWSISFTKHKPIYFWRVWPSISCSLFNIKHPTQTFSYFIIFIYFRPQEIFNWLLLVDDRDYDVWDQPRISWHIKYQRPPPIHQADNPGLDYNPDGIPRSPLHSGIHWVYVITLS